MEKVMERIELSDEDYASGIEALNDGVDPEWKMINGYRMIGVTGRHQVYYTFWHQPPQREGIPPRGPIYMGNLSIDFVEACKKARSKSGKQLVIIESEETIKSMQGTPPEVITFGKYRGQTVGEIFSEDPQYIIWLVNQFEPKNKKQVETQAIMRILVHNYFEAMTVRNLENEAKDYCGEIKEKLNIDAEVKYIKDTSTIDWGVSYRVTLENDDHRFITYLSESRAQDYLQYLRDNVGKTISISGKVRAHKTIVGKKYTILNYVKF